MTAEMFLAYIEQCLVPTLRRNDIVVMDNCRVHMCSKESSMTQDGKFGLLNWRATNSAESKNRHTAALQKAIKAIVRSHHILPGCG